MSKTVKRVMTVMIGLVAMLGVKAEAHYIVVKGRCVWHSGECVRKDKDPGSGGAPPLGELITEPTEVDLFCPNDPANPVVTIFPSGMILATRRTPIDLQRDTTERRNSNGAIISKELEWGRIVSDASFYIGSCLNKSSPPEVIVRTWSNIKMNLYAPPSPQVHSRWEADKCTLLGDFDLDPATLAPLPPLGALYDCGVGGPGSERSCHQEVQGEAPFCKPLPLKE